MARRTNALPDGLQGAAGQPKCGICDAANPPAFRCPDCPRRMTQKIPLFDHGWGRMLGEDRELARAMIRDARAARQLAITAESHPAYDGLNREYIAAGIALARLRAQRHGRPDPFAAPETTV